MYYLGKSTPRKTKELACLNKNLSKIHGEKELTLNISVEFGVRTVAWFTCSFNKKTGK
jgi:hypothetical protein